MGRVDESGADVAGDGEADAAESVHRVQSPQRTQAAVGGGRPADADDDVAGTQVECDGDELSGAVGRRRHRVVALGTADQLESRGSGHLDDGTAAVQPPHGLDRVAERAADDAAAVRSPQSVERSLSPVGHRGHDHVVAGGAQRLGEGVRGLGRGRRASELVGRDHDPHGGEPTASPPSASPPPDLPTGIRRRCS